MQDPPPAHAADADVEGHPWVLLIHQIPPKPDYLRVKVGRRLQRVGAVAVKNSVYVLPDRVSSVEDFQWIRAEIIGGGGDASICRAAFLDGLTDHQLRQLFRAARDADYDEITEAARQLWSAARRTDRSAGHRPLRVDDDLTRLRAKLAFVASIDFFAAAGRTAAEEALQAVTQELNPDVIRPTSSGAAPANRVDYGGRTWVTRSGIFVDRIASAWLIRRFIDRDARFKFVSEPYPSPHQAEIRFDMFDGEFTHEGEFCTFETLLNRFAFHDQALGTIAEIVHDIDLKDDAFQREEALGIERVLSGIVAAHPDDAARLERGSQLFDDLYALFSAKPKSVATVHQPDN